MAPAPPPPPGAGPPPPPPPVFKPTSGGSDGRGMLLDAIRKGKQLKRTEVNDRSAPAVDANKGSSETRRLNTSSNTGSGGTVGRNNALNAPPGLAGLFAGGMPKLKPVGSGASPIRTPVAVALVKSPTGPIDKPVPPQPPPASQKPTYQTPIGAGERPPPERKSSFGKPSVAPKPPSLHFRPNQPAKLFMPPPPPQTVEPENNSTEEEPPSPPATVARAQSMRLPKNNQGDDTPPTPEYRTMGRPTSKAMQPPPPPRNSNASQRSRALPLKPPSARPPPPPNKIPPSHPPPPPPPLNLPPPPPPHRVVPPQPHLLNLHTNLPPAPQSGPPPPPTRNSSMRSSTSAVSCVILSEQVLSQQPTSIGVDLEARFRHLFIPIENLPRPEPFHGLTKTYPSKIAQSQKRQPAPQPPTGTAQIQIGSKHNWLNNTSTC